MLASERPCARLSVMRDVICDVLVNQHHNLRCVCVCVCVCLGANVCVCARARVCVYGGGGQRLPGRTAPRAPAAARPPEAARPHGSGCRAMLLLSTY